MPDNIFIQPSDNTRVVIRKLLPTKITHKPKPIEFPTLKSDTRTLWLRDLDYKKGKMLQQLKKRQQLKDKTNKAVWGTIGLGALTAAQFTPAAPYIDAAFALNGAHNLGNLYDKGTLGLNLETVGNALYMVPLGLRGVPFVSKGYNLILKNKRIYDVNKEFNKGIKENSILESYNSIPANKDIGNAYDYLDFLDNIYPDSKLNSVFYHGGPKGILKFKPPKEVGKNKNINTGTKDHGIYLADDKQLAEVYKTSHGKGKGLLYNVKVNAPNPMRYETNSWYLDNLIGSHDLRFSPASITDKWYNKLNLKNYNGIYHTKSASMREQGELVMFDGKDIHIMGTPEESLMFRLWKLNPLYSSKPLYEDLPITPVQYDKSFINYAKSAKPAVIMGGVPLGMIAIPVAGQYATTKRKEEERRKAEMGETEELKTTKKEKDSEL